MRFLRFQRTLWNFFRQVTEPIHLIFSLEPTVICWGGITWVDWCMYFFIFGLPGVICQPLYVHICPFSDNQRDIILMELKMHRQRIYHSINAIHPKFVVRVSCMHTTHLDAVLLIYKASSRLQRHFCMWHVASTNQNHVHFCGLVVSL